jgi:alkylhydroperoxidase/carboxymuconolactone decarboxylase family protein YurZ
MFTEGDTFTLVCVEELPPLFVKKSESRKGSHKSLLKAKEKKGYYTMSEQKSSAQESLQGLSEGDASRLSFLQDLIARSYTESGLDPQTFMLVRMAALATLDAAPASWLMNIAVSGEAGLDPDLILGTLTAIAPVIGTARVVSAAGNILRALELGEAIAESGE